MSKNAENLIRSGKATIVDVRTRAEFAAGHAKDSINIPLQELPQRVEELRKMDNLVLCCASGNRSAQATEFLKNRGISCENAGSWLDVNCYC